MIASLHKTFQLKTEDHFSRLGIILIACTVFGLGLLFGYLYSLSQETAELVISIIVISLVLIFTLKDPLNGLLALFLFMPFIEQYIELPMGDGIPDLSFSRFTIAFLMVFMLAQAAISKLRFATPSLTEFFLVAAIVGIMSAVFLDSDIAQFIRETLTQYFTPLIMYFFARNLVRDEPGLNKLLWAFAILGLSVATYAIYEYMTGHILFVGKEMMVGALRTTYSEHLYLIRGLLGRSGNFGRVLISTIPISFYLFFNQKSAGRKLLLVVMLFVQFYALFITFNRTSWYALMIGLFVLQFFYPQFRKLYIGIVIVVVIILWATWGQVNESVVVEERINHKTDDFNGRSARWEAAINMWQEKPVRGWGFRAYSRNSGRFREDGFNGNFGTPENNYLNILVATGLIGFVPFMAFLIIPLLNSVRLFFRSTSADWSGFIRSDTVAVYWCVMIGYALGSYTQVQNEPIVTMIPVALAGAVVGTHQHFLRSKKTLGAGSENQAVISPAGII